MEFQDISLITGYHAHVYFDESTCDAMRSARCAYRATALCEEAGKLFSVKVGRVHCKPVGPHPFWSCQLAFERDNAVALANAIGMQIYYLG